MQVTSNVTHVGVVYAECVRSLIRKAYGEIIIWMCPQTIVGFRDSCTMGEDSPKQNIFTE